MHFLFTLPEAGTLRDLSVTVGNQAVAEPNNSEENPSEIYEWKGEMAPGEKKEAVVRYRVLGARFWRYDLGSQRRRVQQFVLDADTAGPVGFLRGSLQPTDQTGKTLRWELGNVVTAQQVAISFPTDALGAQLYLMALSALPVSLVLFALGVVGLGAWCGTSPDPARLLGGLALFGLGLGAATVLAIYAGSLAGLLVGPLAGAFLAAKVLGRRSLLVSLPAALLPATFLSPQNSGLLVLGLASLTFLALWGATRAQKRA